MQRDTTESLRMWAHALPASKMVWPSAFFDKWKYIFWRLYTPYHPFFRDTSLKLGIISAEAKVARWGARQRYLLGNIAPDETIESVVEYLLKNGFGNHFVAWEDEGEVVSLRYVENFKYQYHVRIFEDGEVRAHYEYTPECHPFHHYYEVGFEDRREHFLSILGDRIVPASVLE
jgi:hypothetical protein